jgi:endo-1,4-beta-xylanase
MTDPPAHPKDRGRGRILLLIGCACALALATVASVLPSTARAATQVCSNSTGNIGGAFYTMFVSGGSACITLNSSTNYSTTWSGIGDFVGGIGSNPGSTSANISFSNSLSTSGGGTTLVSLYGWSTNPLVEYYVEDNYVPAGNAAGTFMGTMTSNGGTYNIYEHQQVNQPSIQGTATFEQYLAIRTSPVSSGTITFSNFVSAWASHGMNLGSMNYQVLATEAFGGGSGSSSVTLGGGGGGNTVSVTNPGNQNGVVGTAASVQIHATDSGGAALTYSATGLPAGLSINSSSGLISGTPTATGTSSVTVTATDSTGASGTASFTWTIANTGGGGGGGGGSGSCKVVYTTNSQWPGGFTAQAVITNTGSSAISSWNLGFTFPGDQKLTSDYNGTFAQSGEAVTLTNASYNGSIAAGGSVTVGFQGTWTSSDAAPTAFTLNGATCTT